MITHLMHGIAVPPAISMKLLDPLIISTAAVMARSHSRTEPNRVSTPMSQSAVRERLSLDCGWLFHLGDIPFPTIKGMEPTYKNAKAGKAWVRRAPDYDDSEWRHSIFRTTGLSKVRLSRPQTSPRDIDNAASDGIDDTSNSTKRSAKAPGTPI